MKSIAEYLEENSVKYADEPYIYSKKDGVFVPHTFSEFTEDVKTAARVMKELSGDECSVMIYAENSYEWAVLDLAAMGYGGISIPIDKEWTCHDIENVLGTVSADIIFYSASRSETVKELMKNHSSIKYICIEEKFSEMLSQYKKSSFEINSCSDMNKTVKIIFTSGTTAVPKAIPLTQANLFNNWETLYKRTPMTAEDKSCIFLPLNHIYSGTANLLYTIISGMKVYFSDDILTHTDDIIAVEPTIVCTVPLLLKRMYLNMTEELLTALKKIRFLYCGGSFTEPEIKKWFKEQGINLLEAYGMTETSSVIALEKVGDFCLESTGTIFENLEVKILDPDENGCGEIAVKGGSVTSGYLNFPHNDIYFDSDGFFHTGDTGIIDSENRLFLKGRKKRMLETSDGKNVYADEIEILLTKSGIITKASVYLEDYKVTAKVYSECDAKTVSDFIESVNAELPKYKKIRRFYINGDRTGCRIK